MPPPASPPAHPTRSGWGRGIVLGLFVSCVLAGFDGHGVDARDDDALQSALRVWRRVARDHDLGTRLSAIRALAATRHTEALDKCISICVSPGVHPEHFRELIAPVLAKAFGGPGYARTWLLEFRTRLAAPEHAWLAWHVFRRWVEGDQELHVQLAARALAKQPFHRAAAFDALAASVPSERSMQIARSTIRAGGQHALDRLVVGEAAAALLAKGLARKRDALEVKDIEDLLTLLEDPASPAHTRGVVARILAKLLGSDVAWTDAVSWRQRLEDQKAEALLRREGYAVETRTTPTFLGLRARGKNVCYVIDVSGSMSLPTWALPGGTWPTTRRRSGTRLDLVKEALKESLRTLDRDQLFAIVTFATDAQPLSFTRRPIPATPRNVARASKAVDALSASGSTNLHRGIEIAFGFDKDGVETAGAFVDPSHLQNGFDTIFILTDGSPNVDSYGRALYGQDDAIVNAVQRQNLFRRAEIHCIGMGSSPRDLLKRLAEIGQGEARFLGR